MVLAIEVKDLQHNFGEKQVLNKISLEAKAGQIIGMLGPSGAGKTTLINILTGQLVPAGGQCMVMGKDSRNFEGADYEKFGIMMDSFGLYDRMNCLDNLKFYRMLDGKGTAEVEPLLEKVGLLGAKKTLAADLSKGMRNRLAFARAILRSPRILFLDEPTSGLDPMTTEAIHEMILAQKESGTTIFLTTHNMYEAQKLCDHILLLDEGKIVESGSPKEICRRYNHQKKILLHLVNGEEVELGHDIRAGERIAEYFASGQVETIHSTEPSLETVFMELTGKGLNK